MAWLSRNAMHGGAFGIIEATIMMLGVMLGLSVTHDKSIIILGIVAAGVADAGRRPDLFATAAARWPVAAGTRRRPRP